MDELARQLSSLRDEIAPEWDEARSERLYRGVGVLARRRQRQRIAAAMAGAIGLGALFFGLARIETPAHVAAAVPASAAAQSSSKAADTKAAAAATGGVLPKAHLSAGQQRWLADGSLAQLVSNTAELEIVRDESKHIDLRLLSGAAHFQVVPNKQRHFVVEAGLVQVFVVGTVFDVERLDDRVRVSVSEGKVRVRGQASDASESFVSAGQALWFDAEGSEIKDPSAVPEPSETEVVDDMQLSPRGSAESTERRRRAAHRDASGKASWRSLSQAGDYDAAYRALAMGTPVENDPLALMDAADAARLSGHADASLVYLRRVLREHRVSPVAPLAAFTLARVLLERLGQPSEAAEAFGLARSLAPYGSLAQDALAREVEALSKAGNAHEAYLRARLYVQTYPQGRRLRAVQLYGGLE